MGSGTFPQAWEEVALVTIQLKGGTPYEYMGIIETIDIAQGDYPGESVNNIAGGRMWKQSPEEDGEITLELYPIKGNVADNTGLLQQFAGLEADGTWDTTEPMATNTTFIASVFDLYRRQRNKYMVAIMWTDDPLQDTAFGGDNPGTTAKVALRFYAKDCRIVSHKAEFTEGILKTTVTFKFPAMNKAGTERLWAWESSDDMLYSGTAELPALTYS